MIGFILDIKHDLYIEQIEISRASAKRNNKDKTVNNDLIEFYGSKDGYGKYFSNFALYPITIDGIKYRSSEHYFQIYKLNVPNNDINKKIQESMMTMTPAQVAKQGRDRSIQIRNDWDKIKKEVMLSALRAKFTQHDDLKQVLLNTQDAVLVERSPYDRIWGIDDKGIGNNFLGLLLMQVRDELRK